ncbi:outer membrane protein PgaA [Escherichia coli]|nr:outer membrane protein PgaA [Escherichia coli]
MTELFYHKETIAPDLSDEELADLFYSHLESENYPGALTVTQHTINTSPPFLRLMGTPTSIPNDTWLQGHSFLSTVAKYSNDLPQAEMTARELAYNAPGNQGLRIDYASVLQARGWPRAAENELKKAEVIEPRNINLEVEQAWTALTLQEWQQAAVLTHDVVEREPQDPGVVRLKHAVDVHNLAELRIAGSTGIDAEGPDSGKHDVDLTTIVYSPPLNDNWRGFAGFGYADGQFSEGKGIVRDWLAGVEWRSRNIWLEAEYAERFFNHEHKPGARLSGWYDFNDNWRIGSQLERLSHRVPLRAMKMVLQATVHRLMFVGIRMSGVSTVSPGLSLIFPTVTSVMKSHLRVRNASGLHHILLSISYPVCITNKIQNTIPHTTTL